MPPPKPITKPKPKLQSKFQPTQTQAQLAEVADDTMADPLPPTQAADTEMEDVVTHDMDDDSVHADASLSSSSPSTSASAVDDDDDDDGSIPEIEQQQEDGGVRLSPSLIPTTTTTTTTSTAASLNPENPTPYIHDAGHLLISDPNPLPPQPAETRLTAVARDAAQSLLNHLLTTRPITTDKDSGVVLMGLPPPSFQLPREKRVPAPRAKTKWEVFAERKGIGKDGRKANSGLVYDEERGEWRKKWGYKGVNKDAESQWLVEVDDAKAKAGEEEEGDARGPRRAERKEMVKRQARRERRNEARASKGKG